MGSNNSRLNASGEEVPPKIRPLLLRRIEELRKHKYGGGGGEEGALSKKQLLNDDATIEDQSSPEDETDNNKVSTKETQTSTKEQNMVRVDKLSKVVPLPVYEYGTEEQHSKHEDCSQEKVKHVKNKAEVDDIHCAWPRAENKHEEANTKHDDKAKHDSDHDGSDDDNDDDDNHGDDDDEEEDENDKGRLLGPGSPSFRIYIKPKKIIKEKERKNLTFSVENICDLNPKNVGENQTIVMHQKSPSADSYQSAASQNSGSSIEAVEIESTTTKRRGHKKMKKLGVGKMNLLNVKQVKHRMNPMFSCGGNERNRTNSKLSRGGNDRKSLLSPNVFMLEELEE